MGSSDTDECKGTEYNTTLSHGEQKTIIFSLLTPLLLSILSSSFIIYHVLRDKKRRGKLFHRIMCSLSFYTLLHYVCHILSTLPMPLESGNYGAMGNYTTCTMQGFIILSTYVIIKFHYSLLSVFSFISVTNNFNERIVRKYINEYYILALMYLVSFALTIVAWQLQFIRPVTITCWVDPPLRKKDGSSCSDDFDVFIKVGHAIALINVIVTLGIMMLLYITMRRREHKNACLLGKQRVREQARKKKSTIILRQSSLFCIIYIFFTSGLSFLFFADRFSLTGFHLSRFLIEHILGSLSGVGNVIVYLNLTHKSKQPEIQLEITNRTVETIRRRASCKDKEKFTRRLSKATTRSFHCSEFSIFDGTNPSNESNFLDEVSSFDKDSEIDSESGVFNDQDHKDNSHVSPDAVI